MATKEEIERELKEAYELDMARVEALNAALKELYSEMYGEPEKQGEI